MDIRLLRQMTLAAILSSVITSSVIPKQLVPQWGVTGKIVFSSDRDGIEQIYVMNADGTGQTRLTHDAYNDNQAVWSPDGSKIAFCRERDSKRRIYIMNADGSHLIRLTHEEETEGDPAWSPDGTKIAFYSDREAGNGNFVFEIQVIQADGSNPMTLTQLLNDIEEQPVWSPDGTRIAFSSNRNNNRCIYVMNADGKKPKRLTGPGDNDSPAWSPNGSRIAYISTRAGRKKQIYIMKPDGKNKVKISIDENEDYGPRWSLDGSKIVFFRPVGGNSEIYEMNADGTHQNQLTWSGGNNRFPDWH